jgi:hypothetical protein
MENFKLYLMCVCANKFTLVGFVSFILHILMRIYFPHSSNILMYFSYFLSTILIGATSGGYETYRACKRVLEFNNLDVAKRARSNYNMYCGIVGCKLAIKKLEGMGLDNL